MANVVPSVHHQPVQQAQQELQQLETTVATTTNKNSHSTTRKRDGLTNRDRYRNAARSLPYWLGNDPDCFRWTMGALQLHPQKEEYQELYQASLGSFLQKIMEETTSPVVQKGLETLVELGFGDLAYAKKFRSMKTYQTDHAALQKKLARRTKSHASLLKQVEHHQADIAAMERIADNSRDGHDNNDNDHNDGERGMTVGRVLASVQLQLKSLFGSTEPVVPNDIQQQELASRPPPANRERALQKRRRKLEATLLDLDKSAKLLEALTKEFEDMQSTISTEEYDSTMVVVKSVLRDVCPELAVHIENRHKSKIERYQTMDAKTDLTKPHEWYLHARLDRRKVIFHGGPTNSGKTHAALQTLMASTKGLYVGPLRLLAAEVYETLTSKGVYANLMTGQEKRFIAFATHTVATVELTPDYEDFDVAVIDEIQMIADPHRGHAWTRALMGLRCKEIHVCGGMEAVPLVQKLIEACGDEFELREYHRFSPLIPLTESLAKTPSSAGSYRNVEPGDCVVAFSRADIFAIKREIESTTKHKCCVIYGSLPPETRTAQARRFNNPDSGYDVLVASDAIGMGLNLSIKRIIFNSMFKSNGEMTVQLDHSSVKQIAGRAGRRNSSFPEGEVTCRDPRDMEYLLKCMTTEIPTVPKAGLLPTASHIESFAAALKTYKLLSNDHHYDHLHLMLDQFSEMATLQGDYFFCRQTSMRTIAHNLVHVPISMRDKYTLCMAPVSVSNRRNMTTLLKFAEKLAQGQASGLSTNSISLKQAKSFDDLASLCELHNDLDLFLWLHGRFPGNAMEQQTALTLKQRAIECIEEGLQETEDLQLKHNYIQRDARLRRSFENAKFQDGNDDGEDDVDEGKGRHGRKHAAGLLDYFE